MMINKIRITFKLLKNYIFDVVIGNPPWVQSKFLDDNIKSYFKQ